MNGSRAAQLALAGLCLALVAFGTVSAGRVVGWSNLGGPTAVEPLAFDDYALQYYYGRLGSRFLAETGATYGYDPNFMAGYVKMPLYYPSSKPFEFSLFLQSQVLGIEPARAFNWTVFALLASLPLLALAAAWLFQLSLAECSVVLFLSVIPHNLVPMAGYYSIMEAAGMVSYVFTASLALVVVALVARTLEGGGWRIRVALALTAPLLFLCHLTAGVLVAVPISVLYVSRFRRTDAQTHATLWGVLLLAIALNWLWLRGFVLFGHYADVGDFYTRGGEDHFAPPGGWLAPFRVSVPTPWIISLIPPVFGAAGLALWWRERRMDRLLLFGPQIAFLFVLAFYGVHLGLSAIGPARITLPLGLALFFPAAHALVAAARAIGGWIEARAPEGRAQPLRIAALVAVGAGIVLSGLPEHAFRPYSLPELQHRNGYESTGRGLLDWLAQHTDASGRLLHEETDRLSHRYYGSHLPALIPLVAGVPLANGPAPHALVKHNYLRFIAGTFRGKRLGRVDRAEMSRHLALYNVQWVLCWSPAANQYFERHPKVSPLSTYDKFSLYRVELEPTYFAQGSGIVKARENRLELEQIEPQNGAITLKYHWLETLRTDPPRTIETVSYLDDPVPFIRVLDPPRELVIFSE